MPTGVVLAVLFSAVLHAGWNALLRQSGDRNWAIGWIGVATFLCSAPFIPFTGLAVKAWPFVVGSAALHVVYLSLLARAYSKNELSFAYPIARGTSPLLVAVGGASFAGEALRPLAILGIGAIVVGIIGLGIAGKHWDRHGLQTALAIGAVIAVYTVLDGIGARLCPSSAQYNVSCFALYGFMIAGSRLMRNGSTGLSGTRRDILLALGGGASSVVAYAIVTWAMVHSPLGAVSALRETSTLFAAGIGFLFLNEQFTVQKALGCTAIVVGAAMVGIH